MSRTRAGGPPTGRTGAPAAGADAPPVLQVFYVLAADDFADVEYVFT
ncbi:hypothetical protein [Kocuria rosea]|nr:hypothetical protein [Kocuria polaris]